MKWKNSILIASITSITLCALLCPFNAEDGYTYVQSSECEIPIPKYLKRLSPSRSSLFLAKDEQNITATWQGMSIFDRNPKNAKHILDNLIKRELKTLTHKTERYGYTVYYGDPLGNIYTSDDFPPEVKRIRDYLILLGKTVVFGGIYNKDYINDLLEHCNNHKN